MIYIWDNGESFSCWEVYYLESSLPREIVEPFVANIRPGGKILGVAEVVDWIDGSTGTDLGDWLSPCDCMTVRWPHYKQEISETWTNAAPEIKTHLFRKWAERANEWWSHDQKEALALLKGAS